MTTPVEAQLWLWLHPSWTPSQNHLGWRRWSDSSSTCRSSSVTGSETKAWSVHWFWCSKITSHLPKNLFKPLDFFLVSAADGGAASATLGFGGAATTARSRWSVVLCWGAAVDRSQLKIIMGYGSNRAGDGVNVTVCVSSAHIRKKKNKHLKYLKNVTRWSVEVLPRLGELLVFFPPPRSLKSPRPKELRTFLEPKLSSLVLLFPLWGNGEPAALLLVCQEKINKIK